MRLVEDAKECWKWFSIQAMVVATALQGAWLILPSNMINEMPRNILQGVTIALLAFGTVGRLMPQDKSDAPK